MWPFSFFMKPCFDIFISWSWVWGFLFFIYSSWDLNLYYSGLFDILFGSLNFFKNLWFFLNFFLIKSPIFSVIEVVGFGLSLYTFKAWGLGLWLDMHTLLWIRIPWGLFLERFHILAIRLLEWEKTRNWFLGFELKWNYIWFYGLDNLLIYSFIFMLINLKKIFSFKPKGLLLKNKLYKFWIKKIMK